MKRVLALVFIACACTGLGRSLQVVPQLLIVQLKDPLIESAGPKDSPSDPNVYVADTLAQSLDEDGRVEPIVWSITDPTFRDAVSRGKLGDISSEPSIEEAQRVAGKLGWEYVLIIKVVRSGSDVVGQAKLYRGRAGQLWQDPPPIDPRQLATLRKLVKQKRMTPEEFQKAIDQQEHLHLAVVTSSTDEREIQRAEENTAKSIARTWAEAMTSGSLRNLPAKRRRATPIPAPGQNAKAPDPQPPVTPPKNPPVASPVANDPLRASLKSLLDNHQTSAAIALLRDAIDSAPLDAERRSLLIGLLLDAGLSEQAAQAARQAAAILPDKPGLRVLAARAWLAAGKPEEAQSDLNEAIARDPNSADTRLLLGQISLAKGDMPNALDHLGAGIGKNPTADLYFERALSNAIAGNSLAADADLAKASELGLAPEGALSRYREAVRQMDGWEDRGGDELRTIVQKASLNRKDAAVRVALERAASIAACRAAYIEKLSAPAAHQKSQNQRVLALKLLVQCLGDVRSYLESGDEEAISDARLNLGEALGGLAAARSQFQHETAPPGPNEQS